MDVKATFTTDEEMEELEDRDVTTIITGYIDSITAPQESKNGVLFKFTVSNSSKRICVLVWDRILIEKYQKDICSNRVININGGHCRASKSQPKNEQNLVPFEIIIKENTTVTFTGYYSLTSSLPKELKQVTFDDINTVEGLIEIAGYIRTKFSLTHTRSRHMTYGLGAITDGTKKVTIQVKQFVESNLEIGDYVKVKGTVTGEDTLVTVFCNSMDDIALDPATETMPLASVQRGYRPVKRIRTKVPKP